MKVVLVNAKWKAPNKKHFELENGILEHLEIVKDELELKDNMYIIQEYTKINNKYVSLAIKTNKNLKKVSAISTLGYLKKLEQVGNGLWIYHPEYVWNEKKQIYENETSPIGFNQCGIIFFKGVDFQENSIFSSKVKITPYLITEEEYNIMESEIKMISQNLAEEHRLSKNSNTLGKILINLDLITEEIRKIYEIIQDINISPEEGIIDSIENIRFEKIKKLTPKILLERKLYPSKSSLKANIKIKTYNIKEHRILKGAIYNLLDIFENQKKYENSIIDNTCLQIKDLKKVEISGEFSKNFKDKLLILENRNCKIKERIKQWDEIINNLNDLLELKIFEDLEKEEWNETHIFNFNILYLLAFEEIEKINKFLGKTKSLDLFQNDLIKSYNLYEKWVFFKILDYFINELHFNCMKENLIDSLVSYYNRINTLRGFSFELCNKNNKKIKITYEKNICRNRPDISLVFEDDKNKKECFLDAKYKDYVHIKSGNKLLNADLYQSAERYINLSDLAVGAFLIHPNNENNLENEFNYKKIHRCGYFSLKPNDDKGLRIFAKLAMHFYMGWDNICPDCGELGIIKINNKTNRYYYECTNKNCSSFWVKTYCHNKKHPKNINNFDIYENKLYKYSNYNFHKENNKQWDVHCPICEQSLEDLNKKYKIY